MKKYIIVGLVFVIGMGISQQWGPSIISTTMMVISGFLLGLFIGGRRKHA